MVSAILLHYVIDDPLPTHGTFGDPGSNPGADNFFFVFFGLYFSFSSTCLVLSTCCYYINCFSTWYVRLLLEENNKNKINADCAQNYVLSEFCFQIFG